MIIYFICFGLSCLCILEFLIGLYKFKLKNKKILDLDKIIEFLCTWIKKERNCGGVLPYLSSIEVKYIAVCGFNVIGRTVCDEVLDSKNDNIEICFIIADSKVESYRGIKIIPFNSNIESVELIVVCDFVNYYSVKEKIHYDGVFVPVDELIYYSG